jgi:hypothetical protein
MAFGVRGQFSLLAVPYKTYPWPSPSGTFQDLAVESFNGSWSSSTLDRTLGNPTTHIYTTHIYQSPACPQTSIPHSCRVVPLFLLPTPVFKSSLVFGLDCCNRTLTAFPTLVFFPSGLGYIPELN